MSCPSPGLPHSPDRRKAPHGSVPAHSGCCDRACREGELVNNGSLRLPFPEAGKSKVTAPAHPCALRACSLPSRAWAVSSLPWQKVQEGSLGSSPKGTSSYHHRGGQELGGTERFRPWQARRERGLGLGPDAVPDTLKGSQRDGDPDPDLPPLRAVSRVLSVACGTSVPNEN